jgi:hypothetical protein
VLPTMRGSSFGGDPFSEVSCIVPDAEQDSRLTLVQPDKLSRKVIVMSLEFAHQSLSYAICSDEHNVFLFPQSFMNFFLQWV